MVYVAVVSIGLEDSIAILAGHLANNIYFPFSFGLVILTSNRAVQRTDAELQILIFLFVRFDIAAIECIFIA